MLRASLNVSTRVDESSNYFCEQTSLMLVFRYNMSFMAYNPLAGGILTGKHKKSHDPSSEPDMSGR